LSISTKNPSGMRGGVSSSDWLHHRHGAPAAPQGQAFGPSTACRETLIEKMQAKLREIDE
jgi:hypothetical protein